MGIVSDLLANAKSIVPSSTDENAVGLQRKIVLDLEALVAEGDFAYPAAYQAINEVQSLAEHVPTVSGGTFTLTYLLKNGETFTTAAIVYEASAATIETAVDTAATSASITGWTNGDITVSGGHLNTAPIVSTYDGASVAGLNHPSVTIDGGSLTGGGSAGAVSVTTEGQTTREAWALLNELGLTDGVLPVQGVAAVAYTPVVDRAENSQLPSVPTLQALADEAAISDGVEGNAAVIKTALGI